MKRKQILIGLISLAMVLLAACGDTQTYEAPEAQASETDTFKTAELQAPETDPYEISKTSVYRNPDSGYEIDDMLPNPPIRIMSVEEAEAFMNKKQNKDEENDTVTEDGDEAALIVYFSKEDNIHQLAEYFSEETDAEVFSIRTVEAYPTGDLDKMDLSAIEKYADARPALSSHVENMDDYDVIYLGYPVCLETLPIPVASFLEEYDFSGKTIIPFTSYENSGFGSGVSMIRELCPEAEVLDGFAIRDSKVNTDEAKEKVAEFIAGL